MKLQGTVTIHAPLEIVWEIINDPSQMQKCMPGCTALRERGENTYLAALEIAVATLRGSFEAELRLSDKVPGQGYRLDVAARGMTGEVRGGGAVSLAPQGLGTLLSYAGELHVSGMLATIGQHFLKRIVEDMTGEFFAGLGALAEAAATAGTARKEGIA